MTSSSLRLTLPTPHLIYGGDYNPEQWPEETWLEDARLMREAGVNLVSLGIFSWARLEPKSGDYDFAWLDRLMDLLHAHGISVNLATPTAAPPAWLVRRHPEMLPVTSEGVILWHGSRRHYCPHSTAYHRHATALVTKLAERYGRHSALVLWHVDNEYGCHVTECFCEISVSAFRQWLQQRYGTLENLNHAWGTAFWSQHYYDWEEVQPPRKAPTFINPSQRLDWMRFNSDSWVACFDEQKNILRELTPNVPVTTNLMGFHKPIDYWKLAARKDIVANDNYPDMFDPQWMVRAAMVCDLMRSLGNRRPWILMEQAPTHVNWRQRNATKWPGMMRLCSCQAIARGADGIMFFQWRASKAGAEKHHSGMLPHVGTDSRVWREVSALGGELPRLDPILRSEVMSEVAILLDWESWWALELEGKPSNDLRQLQQLMTYYGPLYRCNITTDFAHPEADLSRYRLVIAPTLYLVNDRAITNLKRYVENGGALIISFFSGIVDENEHIRLGGYPAPFCDLLGLRVEEFAPYAETQSNTFTTADGRQFACALWSDIIRLHGAEAIASYEQDYYAGLPAITRHTYGKGVAYYVGTEPEQEGLTWLLDRVCVEAGVGPVAGDAPDGIEILRRTNGKTSWLFALNHSSKAVSLPLEHPGHDLLTGATVNGSVVLEPTGVAVIETER
jgi:beta-galactosidase